MDIYDWKAMESVCATITFFDLDLLLGIQETWVPPTNSVLSRMKSLKLKSAIFSLTYGSRIYQPWSWIIWKFYLVDVIICCLSWNVWVFCLICNQQQQSQLSCLYHNLCPFLTKHHGSGSLVMGASQIELTHSLPHFPPEVRTSRILYKIPVREHPKQSALVPSLPVPAFLWLWFLCSTSLAQDSINSSLSTSSAPFLLSIMSRVGWNISTSRSSIRLS